MPRTPSDFNSRGPKPGAKPGPRSSAPRASEGGKFSGAKGAGGKGFARSRSDDERDFNAKSAPRRDSMPVFDAEPERPARAAKPEGRSFGAKSFGAKPEGKSFGVKSFGTKPEGKSFGAKPSAGRGFAGQDDERPARGGARAFGAKAPGARNYAERDDEGGAARSRPFGAKPQGKSAPRGRPSRDEGTSPISMPVKDASAPERIAKAMSRGGVASRRDAEKMILEGRVMVNGKVIDSPALTVTVKDKITIDGHVLAAPEPPRLWMYHKPEGLVTSARDELGRPTVFDDLPDDMPRVMSVGRLDLTSEGLLLLTNDGEVKRKLELPSTGWLRKYRVRVNGRPMDTDFEPLRQGIVIDGEVFAPMIVALDRQQGANAWLTVAIREGRNREIRRGMEAVGYQVNRLIRVSYGPFQLGDLKPGEVAEVRPKILRDQLGLGEEEAEEGFRAPERGTRTTSRTITRSKPGAKGARSPREESAHQERSPYAPRSASAERGERPNYAKPKATDNRAAMPYGERSASKPYGDRAASAERGASKPYGARSEAPYGERSASKSYGDRAASAERGASKPYGARSEAPYGERSGSKSYGDRAASAERGAGKPYGARSEAPKPYGGAAKPAGAKPGLTRGGARAIELDAPKPAWARGGGAGKSSPAKPFGGKPSGGGKPFGGKPSGGARKR